MVSKTLLVWLPFLLSSLLLSSQHISVHAFSAPNNLQLEVAKSRNFYRTGLVSGGGIVAASAALGVSIGLVDANNVILGAVGGCAAFSLFVESNNQRGTPPVSPESFQVMESLIPDAGMGLFCATEEPLPKGAFLFPYDGEILTEDEYFQRYPTGQGRYVAEVPTFAGEPVYIDGANPDRSGLARWMNSKPIEEANVEWRKQSFGSEAGSMYFYASRDISKGVELTFDYGSSYWDAVGEE
eukprot:CAMPEP_0119015524 /NCGR_PEP_ID=MMETSP1176-20130426/11174_1 /TAXON_ID=265551 /ORGANISM="Synedropsis recta cf, Strain CCMP1620" /LENGTH=239 /DNA_ID=CAMNT_0006968823 /DNA_START=15 /DNA_END=734 /DNA_ORIENTATION=-